MSDKKSKPSTKKADTTAEAQTEKIPFQVWFQKQVMVGKLNFWQANEISVFFTEKGLSDNEEADKYSELLKLY